MATQPRRNLLAQANSASRRDFLKASSLAAVGGTAAYTLAIARSAHAAGDDVLRVGLIGCGGRGSGAAADALQADPNVKLVAMGDAFEDRLRSGLDAIRDAVGDQASRIDVPEERRFVGFDAYQKVIDCGVDVVLLTSPPHFRPMHLKAAVAAGKHVFAEKPVAVDAPGVRSVLESAAEAQQKGLSIVSGLCWRYDAGTRETMRRILDGEIGEIIAIQANYNTGPVWHHARKPEWSEMEYQLRNWCYFTWLSGDFNVEQHVHTLDKAAWAMCEEPPIRATGMGGRQVRVEPQYGNIYDHHAVCYEYANGVRLYSYCRQIAGCADSNEAYILGAKGQAQALQHVITGQHKWHYRGPDNNMYRAEHEELFASIRSAKPINNGLYMAHSTMMAIMGRMCTYTGQTITWDDAMNSQEDLSPAKYEWGPLPTPKVAMPGITRFL